MKRKTKIILAAFLLLAAAGLAWVFLRPHDATGETELVARGTVAETVSVTGELAPRQYADLGFAVTGEVASVSVIEGESVAKSQLIASLDASVLNAQYAEAQTALEIAIQNEWLARRQQSGGEIEKEEMGAKKLATEAARLKKATIAAQIATTRIRAPFAGVIEHLDVRPGEPVGPNDRIARLVGPLSGYVVEAKVPESDIAGLRAGMPAEITFDAFPSNEVFQAEIIDIERTATVIESVVSYTTSFRLLNSAGLEKLFSGMTANIDVVTERRENVLILPYRALRFEGGTPYVLVAKEREEPERREVGVGLEGDGGSVEIVSGLTEGDRVVVGPAEED